MKQLTKNNLHSLHMAKVNPEILIWARKADPELVGKITDLGYAPNLDETELEKVGHDPFLISYGYADIKERCVITFEVPPPPPPQQAKGQSESTGHLCRVRYPLQHPV